MAVSAFEYRLIPKVNDASASSLFLDLQHNESCLHVFDRKSVRVKLSAAQCQPSVSTSTFVTGARLVVGTECLYVNAAFGAEESMHCTLRVPYTHVLAWKAKDPKGMHFQSHTHVYLAFSKYTIVRDGAADVEINCSPPAKMWLQVGKMQRRAYQGPLAWYGTVERLRGIAIATGGDRDTSAVVRDHVRASRVSSLRIDGKELFRDECVWITPFCEVRGQVSLDRETLAFLPYCSDASSSPECGVFRINVGDILTVRRRAYILASSACEVFYKDGGDPDDVQSLLVFFDQPNNPDGSSNDTKEVLQMTKKFLRALDPFIPAQWKQASIKDVQRRWRNNQLSNFDYLMLLNDHAGRSFQNIYQYPIFPWVLSDYESPVVDLNDPESYRDLSKPAAALSPQRVDNALEMYQALASMPEITHPWMYGTHYSNPGIISYFKVRQWPKLQLRLQSGRFDNPNRMFHSMAAAWSSISNSSGDCKELIPELYHPGRGIALLTNDRGAELGERSDGTRLGDVQLPPWAVSPLDFLTKMRMALESPYVSAHLHLWIDLVFGCASRGPTAEARQNVFQPMTYDEVARKTIASSPSSATKLEAREFGRTPPCLFTKAHPKRRSKVLQPACFCFSNLKISS